jgi:hypothetical protein
VNAAGERHPILRLQAPDLRETTNLLFEDAGIHDFDTHDIELYRG